VIPVYEHSWYFQNYISQAYTHLRNEGFTHYLIIADDLIVNPIIDENNIWEMVGVRQDEPFVPATPIFLQRAKGYWGHFWEAMKYRLDIKGVEVESILPTKEQAEERFRKYDFPTGAIPWNYLIMHHQNWWLGIKNLPWKRKLKYPIIGCYSDTFMITEDVMERFCTYCGAFAATRLHVELAIPTSLVLASEKVRFQDDLKLKYGALWPKTIGQLDKYKFNLQALLDDFPKDKFFLHPIKLSKWQ
jgi:hypothetical protein